MLTRGIVPILKLSLPFRGKQTCRLPVPSNKTLAMRVHCGVNKRYQGVLKKKQWTRPTGICGDGMTKAKKVSTGDTQDSSSQKQTFSKKWRRKRTFQACLTLLFLDNWFLLFPACCFFPCPSWIHNFLVTCAKFPSVHQCCRLNTPDKLYVLCLLQWVVWSFAWILCSSLTK